MTSNRNLRLAYSDRNPRQHPSTRRRPGTGYPLTGEPVTEIKLPDGRVVNRRDGPSNPSKRERVGALPPSPTSKAGKGRDLRGLLLACRYHLSVAASLNQGQEEEEDESHSDPATSTAPDERLRKRRKPNAEVSMHSDKVNLLQAREAVAPAKKPRTKPLCALLTAAHHTAAHPGSRKNSRRSAFGDKLPVVLFSDDAYDFELPKFSNAAGEERETEEEKGDTDSEEKDRRDH
ncbi:hypothetical protein B0H19DRAFT_1064332 [Mycena capillaripes]|nr:hypothetical protein B0H19DRAFT_1064332 [Mycena capillaripes]